MDRKLTLYILLGMVLGVVVGQMLNQLAYMLGGRAAEELIFHDPTTGAANDIEKATAVARAMVTQYGMTERVLAARRGAVRVFRKFETLVGYLKDLGISQFSVNAADFDVGRVQRPPDAARLRRARRLRVGAHAPRRGPRKN